MTTDTAEPRITGRSTLDLLEAVEGLRPVMEANALVGEVERRTPDEVYRAMVEAGLFDMAAPRAYGGLEMHPVEIMRVWEAVARIDSAAAWNLVMNQALGAAAAWLPDEGAREVFADGPTTVAGALFPPGSASRVEGGWRVTTRCPFASGCHNARWFVLPALEMAGDEPYIDPATGQPVGYAFVIPREDGEIIDTWHTLGMRGTGSADIAVTNVFVPDRRAFRVAPLADPAPGFEGPLYRMFPLTAVLGEATVSVGVAAAAVNEVIALVKTKTPAYNVTPLREQPFAQDAVARAEARVNAARDTLYRAAAEAYDDAATGALLSWDSKIRVQLAASFAAEACAEAVRLVNEAAGSAAIRVEHRFERHLRDAHTLTQHSSKSRPRYASAGRLMFGLENDWVWLSF